MTDDFPHGTVRGYKRGCRCDDCGDAKSQYAGHTRVGRFGIKRLPPEPEHVPPDGWRFRCLQCGRYFFGLARLGECLNGCCPEAGTRRMDEAS